MSTETVEERLAALEARNRALEAEVTALRRAAEPPAPRPPREVLGQAPRGPHGDMTGVNYSGPPTENMSVTSGTHRFNSWRTRSDGSREYAPDGVPRDPRTGEALAARDLGVVPDSALPTRTHMHQQAVDMIDAMLPITPPAPRSEG